MRLHDLRHTFATRLIQSGIDVFTVQKLLGHSTITMTMRYVHSFEAQMRDAVARLEEKFAQSLLNFQPDPPLRGWSGNSCRINQLNDDGRVRVPVNPPDFKSGMGL